MVSARTGAMTRRWTSSVHHSSKRAKRPRQLLCPKINLPTRLHSDGVCHPAAPRPIARMNPRPVIVRLARPLEAGDIALMCRDLIERGLGWSWTRGKVAKNMANRDITTLAACDGKQLVGFA